MGKLHLIMPMAGGGTRFKKEGYLLPKPLIEIEGKPFFYWATLSIIKYVEVEDIHFIVLEEHVKKFSIDRVIKKYFENAIIIVIPEILQGPVLTCLEGVKNVKDNLPVLFNDCDHMFKSQIFNKLINEEKVEADGILLTFTSTEPQFSYIYYDENGNFKGTVEKEQVSLDAVCGAYYFKNVDIFRIIAQEYLINCNYSEYFMSGLYNIMYKKGLKVKNYNIDFHVEFGTPKEYEKAKFSKMFIKMLEEK